MKRKDANLTDAFLERAWGRLPESGQAELWDRRVRGFGARLGRRGVTLFYRYRFRGTHRRLSLGRWPENAVDGQGGARERAAAARQAVEQGRDPAQAAKERRTGMSLAQFFNEHWATRHGRFLRPRGLESAMQNFRRHVEPTLGQLPLVAIELVDVEAVLAAMQKQKLSGATCNRVRALIQSIFAKARQWRLLPPEWPNPAELAPKFKEEARERLPSSEEVGRLGAALREMTPKGAAASPFQLVQFLILTGLRVSEACALRWENVDLERGLATLEESKTGKRTAVLGAPAVRFLRHLPRPRGQVWVFPSPRRQEWPLDRAEVRTRWLRLRRKAGISGLRLHDLRHLVASAAVAGGASLYQAGGLLGHRQASTTQRYAHHDSAALRDVADKVGEALEGQLAGRVVDISPSKAHGQEQGEARQ